MGHNIGIAYILVAASVIVAVSMTVAITGIFHMPTGVLLLVTFGLLIAWSVWVSNRLFVLSVTTWAMWFLLSLIQYNAFKTFTPSWAYYTLHGVLFGGLALVSCAPPFVYGAYGVGLAFAFPPNQLTPFYSGFAITGIRVAIFFLLLSAGYQDIAYVRQKALCNTLTAVIWARSAWVLLVDPWFFLAVPFLLFWYKWSTLTVTSDGKAADKTHPAPQHQIPYEFLYDAKTQ